MTHFPDDGLGLNDFMRAGTLDVPEPDWIHAVTPLSKVSPRWTSRPRARR